MIVMLNKWKKRIGAGVLALLAAGVASTGQAEIVSPVLRDSLTFMPPTSPATPSSTATAPASTSK